MRHRKTPSAALIHTYFGNKDQLFDAVFGAHHTAFLDQLPSDDRPPRYAGRLFDRHRLSHFPVHSR